MRTLADARHVFRWGSHYGGTFSVNLVPSSIRSLSHAVSVPNGWQVEESENALDHYDVSSITDLTMPASWYPTARAMQRRIVAHLGPTNSGKTHAALAALSTASSGVYCGPLRLLAWEVAEKLNAGAIPCSLITGQEVRRVDGARHAACTVEMASVKRKLDVAVVDEVQLVGDESRGWAFTRALLGVPARELHVCGDPAVLPLLQRLCLEAGETLEVREYTRLSSLRPGRFALESLDCTRPGDCLVAFSRREVHSLRHQIEALSGRRCAVVYGGLPPESRSQQAALFNAPRSGVNVLAASDAVGMGLNLSIRRIVFTTLTKYDGRRERQLTPAEIRQIAGRAGRFGSRYPAGTVTTLRNEDLPELKEALAAPPSPVKAAALFPRFQQLAAFAAKFPEANLVDILDQFSSQAIVNKECFFFAHFDDVRTNAVMLRHLPLSLFEAYVFSISPSDPGDDALSSALLSFATSFVQHRTVSANVILHAPLRQAMSSEELAGLETIHRMYDLYIWLSYRFSKEFVGREAALHSRALCSALIDVSIRDMGIVAGRRRVRNGVMLDTAPHMPSSYSNLVP